MRRNVHAFGGFGGLDAIVAGALLMLVGILGIRMLLQENALLKVDLQGRTVELGAVSSLLTVCHDAVVEVDECLRLTNESPQISFMRLSTAVKDLKLATLFPFFFSYIQDYTSGFMTFASK